jgi:hypothetical protein
VDEGTDPRVKAALYQIAQILISLRYSVAVFAIDPMDEEYREEIRKEMSEASKAMDDLLENLKHLPG